MKLITKKFSIKNVLFLLWIIGLLLYTWIPNDMTNVTPYIQPQIIILVFILSLIWYFKKKKKFIISIIILILLSQVFTYFFIEWMKLQNS